MRAELYRPESPEVVVAVATWDGVTGVLESGEGAPQGLEALLRPTAVVVEDPSLRRQGTHGESVLQPGSLEWFRAALVARAEPFGLAVRFVPLVREGGWDPAAQYRTFGRQVDRLIDSGS
jgi:hypothetical protein